MELFLIIFLLILLWQNDRRVRRVAMIIEVERQEAQRRYEKLHLEGKTDQAKAGSFWFCSA